MDANKQQTNIADEQRIFRLGGLWYSAYKTVISVSSLSKLAVFAGIIHTLSTVAVTQVVPTNWFIGRRKNIRTLH